MGSDYSRIKGTAFPQNYFVLIFRQPDALKVVHANSEIVSLVRQTILAYWPHGTKSEKKNSMGVEYRLMQEPFGLDFNNIDRLISSYKLCNQLLHTLLSSGYELVGCGHLLRCVERSAWIFKIPSNRASLDIELVTFAVEDWGKVILINSFDAMNKIIIEAVKKIWPKGIEEGREEPTVCTFNLLDQPWDSYKSPSEKTPYIILEIFRILASFGYEYVTSSHVRGNMDAVTFKKSNFTASYKLCGLSFNQRDQIRLYSAPADMVRSVCKLSRECWDQGVLKDEQWGNIAVTQLKGSPWFIPDWDKDSVTSAKEFFTLLISEIRSQGWIIIAKMDIYRSAYDKSLLVLQQVSSAVSIRHFSMTAHDTDRLCFIGIDDQLKTAVSEEMKNVWNHEYREDIVECPVGWNVEYCLDGSPWVWDSDSPTMNLEGTGLVCSMLEYFREHGWRVVVSLDVTSSSKFVPSTWIFSMDNQSESST